MKRRGPYKSYFARDGDGIMPRSTFYAKLAKCRHDLPAANDDNLLPDDNDNNINKVNSSPHGDVVTDNYLTEDNVINEIIAPPPNQHTFIEIDTEAPAPWIYEEYDEETIDKIWFDAEDSLPVPDHYTGYPEYRNLNSDKHTYTSHDYEKTLCNCTTITRGEALMMVLALAAEESLTWKTITAILSLINTLFQKNVVPESKYKLFQTLQLDEDNIEYHLYCNECFYYFGAKKKPDKQGLVCEICINNEISPDIAYFLTFDVFSQLKSILEDSEVQ